MSEKQKIYGLISAIVLGAGVFLYAVWNTATVQREGELSQTGLPAAPRAPVGGQPVFPNQGDAQVKRWAQEKQTSFRQLTETVLKPFTLLVSGGDGGTAPLFAQKQAPREGVPAQPQQNQPIQQLSEEEIFDRLWPWSYRNALIAVQNQMVAAGFIPQADVVSVFKADGDIYRVMRNLLLYAERNDWVTAEDAAKLRKGLEIDLPAAIATDRHKLKTTGAVSGAPLPRNQHVVVANTSTLARDLIDGLKYVFSVRYANAQIPGVPGWHTAPDCYKDLAPIFPPGGPDLWSFCCNCGLLCVGPVCTFVPDCGPFSVACTVPLGCLNLMCKAWPNAIWDAFWYPLGTGICGCG